MSNNLVSYSKLFNSTPEQRDELIKDSLGITPEERKSLKGVLDASVLLYRKALEKGLKKAEAAGQITYQNLASLLGDWKQPVSDVFNVVKDVSDLLQKIEYNENTTKINSLRGYVFEIVHKKPMRYNKEKTGNYHNVEFSSMDLARGTKIPATLDERLALLMGVYFMSARPAKMNKIYFEINKRNVDFFAYCVKPLVYDLFNLNIKITKTQTKKRGFNNKYYEFDKLGMYIASLAHFTFFTRQHNYIDAEKKFRVPDIILESYVDPARSHLKKLFFTGIIASGGALVRENNYRQLKFFNRNKQLLGEIQKISLQLGFNSKLAQKKNSYVLWFSRKETIRMAEDGSAEYWPAQVGYFINPQHIRAIYELYFRYRQV